MTTDRCRASSARGRQTDRVKAGLRPPLETSKRGERDVLVDALTGNIAWNPPGESARHRIDATRLTHSHACGQHLRHREDHYQIRRPLLDLQERSGLDAVQASNPIRWHQPGVRCRNQHATGKVVARHERRVRVGFEVPLILDAVPEEAAHRRIEVESPKDVHRYATRIVALRQPERQIRQNQHAEGVESCWHQVWFGGRHRQQTASFLTHELGQARIIRNHSDEITSVGHRISHSPSGHAREFCGCWFGW